MFTTIDCASLLMRLLLHGCPPTAQQRRELAAYVARHFAKPGVPFLNVHLALAHGCAGDENGLGELSERMASPPMAAGQSGAVAERLCAAIADYLGGRFGSAAETLDEVAPRLTTDAEPKAREIVRDRASRRAGHLNEGWFEWAIRRAASTGGASPRRTPRRPPSPADRPSPTADATTPPPRPTAPPPAALPPPP